MNYVLAVFRENLPLKLIALGLTILLWAYVMVHENRPGTREITVPVVVRNVPQGLAVLRKTPERTRLSVRGLRRAVDQIKAEEIFVVADLSGRGVGEHTVPLKPENLPSGVDLASLGQPTVTVELDKIIQDTRPVTAHYKGRPAEGYVLGKIEVRPDEVKIRGASNLVARVEKVVAEWDVSGLSKTTEAVATVVPVDGRDIEITGLTLTPDEVTLTFTVSKLVTKTVPIDPQISSPAEGYEVDSVVLNPLTVTITGSSEALGRTSVIRSEVVDLSGLRGRKSYNVRLNFPQGVEPVGAGSVTVTVSVAEQAPLEEPATDETTPSPPEIEPGHEPAPGQEPDTPEPDTSPPEGEDTTRPPTEEPPD